MLETAADLDEAFRDVKHEVHRGALDKKHPFRTVVLSTAQNDSVESRYVVLRMVDKQLHLYFYTDVRTPKVQTLRKQPNASVLMYHPRKKLQLRIKGTIEILHAEDAAAFWKDIHGIQKRDYGSKLVPGTEVDEPKDFFNPIDDITQEHFAVLRFSISGIDALELGRKKHIRCQFLRNGEGWKKSWLAP